MEQKIIEKKANQCIYFIKETNLSFYLIIPNSRQVKIVLGLFDEVNDEFVKNIPVQSDKTIVIPVIGGDILNQANIVGTPSHNYLNQVLSFLINTSHKILTHNNISVDNQIYLNQSSKLDVFNQNFIAKYQGRVQAINIFPEKSIASPVSIVEEPITKEEPTLSPNIDNVLPTQSPIEEQEEPLPQIETHEPGFVSYVLLGVLVAVISLVFLYLII